MSRNYHSASQRRFASWPVSESAADLHGGPYLGHGFFGACAGTVGAVFENFSGVGFGVAGTAFLDGIENLHQGIGGPAFAFDAADARGAAAFVNLGQGFGAGEDLVEVAHRALVGIAGIGAAD